MLNVLLVIHIIITAAMVIIILLQKTSADGMSGLGGSSATSLLSGRASANILTRTTAILAMCFMLNCLVMAAISARESGLIEQLTSKEDKATEQPVDAPSAPSAPLAE